MRLVEAVAGELLHLIEDFCRRLFRMPILHSAFNKACALLGHLFGLFLAHGAAQQIGFTERVTRQHVGDLHDLLLVDHHTTGLLEHLLHRRQRILNLAPAPLAFDEVIGHAALNRTRAEERRQCRELFKHLGLVTPQHVAHARRFKLEDARRERILEDNLEGLFVVERNVFNVDLDATIQLNQLQAIGNDGERCQAQKVELQQAHLFDGLHVVGRHNFIILRA